MYKFIVITILITCECVYCYPSNSIPAAAAIYTPFNNVGDIVNGKIQSSILSKTVTFSPPFPDSGRKYAILETETLDSQKQTAYGRLHEFVASITNPQPVIDNTAEYEKYGNDGGIVRVLGTKVVAGYEGFSNLVNAAVDVPFEIMKQVGRKITKSLNTLGGKVSGIAR